MCDASALVGEHEELSYAALAGRALRCQQARMVLRARGVQGIAGCTSVTTLVAFMNNESWLPPCQAPVENSHPLHGASQLLAWSCPAMQAVLLGYYRIPESAQGIELVLNPQGADTRSRARVWNSGDGRVKLLLLSPVAGRTAAGSGPLDAAAELPSQPDEEPYLWDYVI